jgi:hypothetical protein
MMVFMRTRVLIGLAVFCCGLLAGGAFDRIVVGGPAWHDLGSDAWAQFSRHADLGTGLLVYPAEAIGAAVLLIAAVISRQFDPRVARTSPAPLYLAALLSIAGLLLTIKAAPIMLGLGSTIGSADARRAFESFYFWGLDLRGSVDVLSFICAIWALASHGRALRPNGN